MYEPSVDLALTGPPPPQAAPCALPNAIPLTLIQRVPDLPSYPTVLADEDSGAGLFILAFDGELPREAVHLDLGAQGRVEKPVKPLSDPPRLGAGVGTPVVEVPDFVDESLHGSGSFQMVRRRLPIEAHHTQSARLAATARPPQSGPHQRMASRTPAKT